MLTARALSTAARNRGFPPMSPPPRRAEMVISLMTLVQTLDFLASEASFLCLILDQRLCPDMTCSLPYHRRDFAGENSRRPPPRRRLARRLGPGGRVITGPIEQPVRALARRARRRDVDPTPVDRD